MVNTVNKGRRNEKRCRDELKDAGYMTYSPPRSKFGEQDIFGLFDVLAVYPHRQGIPPWGSPLLIQVKSNKCPAAVRRAIKEWDCGEQFRKMIWIWEDYKGWRKETIL